METDAKTVHKLIKGLLLRKLVDRGPFLAKPSKLLNTPCVSHFAHNPVRDLNIDLYHG